MNTIGPMTEMALQDPNFSKIAWKLTPASMATRLSGGKWVAWPYLQLLSRKLVDVAMGRCKRLIVVMPPRHGKSEMVSKWFPVWYMEMFQENRVILTSYEAEFAAKWGGKVRDIFQENEELLDLRFKTKMPAMHNWETDVGGAMMTAGVGGPITGKGANIFIIDDYVKNAEEANSLTMRNKLWDWWLSTARTRLEPNASVIVMATRWHSDDLIGRLLSCNMDGEKGVREEWEVFCFPAIAEPEAEDHYRLFGAKVNDIRVDSVAKVQLTARERAQSEESAGEWRDLLGRTKGKALCPDRYDEQSLGMIQGGSSPVVWFSLYQQRPGDEASDGNVYSSFDEVKNCKLLERDDRMKLFISLDFNVDPMCAVIGQYSRGVRGMERVEILEEVVLPNSNTYKMSERLIQELQKYKRGYQLQVEIYGDAAGTQRNSASQKTNWQIVAEHFNLAPNIQYSFIRRNANPFLVDRFNAMNMMLCDASGGRRMFIDDIKCPHLKKDFLKVKLAEDSAGNKLPTLDKTDKDRTHISDACGYAIEYLFSLKNSGNIAKRGILM